MNWKNLSIDREAYRDAYELHSAALKMIPTTEQDDFWTWCHARIQETLRTHNNSPLIQNLLVAVFEDLEVQYAAARSA